MVTVHCLPTGERDLSAALLQETHTHGRKELRDGIDVGGRKTDDDDVWYLSECFEVSEASLFISKHI